MNDYKRWLGMTRQQQSMLLKRAEGGNIAALREFKAISRSIKSETNKRLARLERAHLDYGSAYNNMMYFLQTQYSSNRAQSATKLGNDLYEIYTQNIIAAKFLKAKSSTVEQGRLSEEARIDALVEHGVLPENFSISKNRQFMRFLGNEEVSAAIDEYGISDTVVEMIYDAYKQNKSNAFPILKKALVEHLSGKIKFDEAFRRVGVNVEDYGSKNWKKY